MYFTISEVLPIPASTCIIVSISKLRKTQNGGDDAGLIWRSTKLGQVFTPKTGPAATLPARHSEELNKSYLALRFRAEQGEWG